MREQCSRFSRVHNSGQGGTLLLDEIVDSFVTPNLQRFLVLGVDLDANRIDGVIVISLNCFPILADVLW